MTDVSLFMALKQRMKPPTSEEFLQEGKQTLGAKEAKTEALLSSYRVGYSQGRI